MATSLPIPVQPVAVALGLVARWLVGGVLCAAAISKLLHPKNLAELSAVLPGGPVFRYVTAKPLFVELLAWAELTVGGAVFVGIAFWFCAPAAALLLVCFALFLTFARLRGYEGPCLCFSGSNTGITAFHIGRTGILAVFAAMAVCAQRFCPMVGYALWSIPADVGLASATFAFFLLVLGLALFYVTEVLRTTRAIARPVRFWTD